MDCTTFQERLPATMSDRVGSTSRTLLAEHAAGCSSCRESLHEWEEAQRAIESTLGTSPLGPQQVETLADSIYADHFGAAVDLRSVGLGAGAAAPFAGFSLLPFLAGAILGVTFGMLISGSRDTSNSLMEQLYFQEMLAGNVPGGWGGFMGRPRGGAWPGAMPWGVNRFATGARDLFFIGLLIWFCRTRLIGMLFPVIPAGLQLARALAIPLIVVGIARFLAMVAIIPMAGSGGMTDTLELLLVTIDIGWRYGFWVLLFLFFFLVVEHGGRMWMRGRSAGPTRID